MRFTRAQYIEATQNLHLGEMQLEPDGENCTICGSDGHQAMECGRNPLVAMQICVTIARQSSALHEALHSLAGYNSDIGGEQAGPARIIIPESGMGSEVKE